MGEAKRRATEIARLKDQQIVWRARLSTEEKMIVQTAERLDERLVRGRKFSEGCYHLAFFMTRYLSLHGILVTPVIGWVNDGLWKGMTSHAWIEFNGKKTDASLTCTSYPDKVPTGPLIAHDYILRSGKANYTYYKNDDTAVQASLDWMRREPGWADVIAYKEGQHREMMAIAKDDGIDTYLSKAPVGGTYTDIAALIN